MKATVKEHFSSIALSHGLSAAFTCNASQRRQARLDIARAASSKAMAIILSIVLAEDSAAITCEEIHGARGSYWCLLVFAARTTHT